MIEDVERNRPIEEGTARGWIISKKHLPLVEQVAQALTTAGIGKYQVDEDEKQPRQWLGIPLAEGEVKVTAICREGSLDVFAHVATQVTKRYDALKKERKTPWGVRAECKVLLGQLVTDFSSPIKTFGGGVLFGPDGGIAARVNFSMNPETGKLEEKITPLK